MKALLARRWARPSIKLRLVLVFLLLAAALATVFFASAQRAFKLSWREAAQPLLMDYVDTLSAQVTDPVTGNPSVARAQAIVQRLPLTVRISGPQVQWQSHPEQNSPPWQHDDNGASADWAKSDLRRDAHGEVYSDGDERRLWQRLLQRNLPNGHRIEWGINDQVFERRPALIGASLLALLLLTLLAGAYVRHLLRPLDAIGAGARRFGAGDFAQPIAPRWCAPTDELGELARTVNTMGQDIGHMLDAKRAMLLAISHELRSPLTRARLNTELLPDDGPSHTPRQALLRDLQEMANLINDLLESERLQGQHVALQREPTDVAALAREVVAQWQAGHPAAADVRVLAAPDLPVLALDATRLRLLLRNLLDNTRRHAGTATTPPELRLHRSASGLRLELRDFGPGVSEAQLSQLAQAFYRPDSARTRSAGGVGLGLYLCRLVAQAHGGSFELGNAKPGLRVTVTLADCA